MAVSHKILFTTLLLLIVAATVTVMLFSFTQVTDKETTGNGSSESYGNKFCESKIAYNPSKFSFKNDTNHVITCKWDTKNSTVRILLGLAVVVISIITYIFLMKGRKIKSIISSIIIFVLSCLTIYSVYLDATAVKTSRAWCLDDGPGMATGQGLVCLYNNYILVIGLNIVAIILMIAAPIIVIKNRHNIEGHHHHHHHHDSEEQETTPLVNDQSSQQSSSKGFQQQQSSYPYNDFSSSNATPASPQPPAVSLNPFL
ncbi:hypothetical protein DFA_06944 [Cavenderia fasciculata]|uniref:Transmembrane protein n=1 Tax=Cavenderia fasciculata TaxID=261658 RepID=F4PX39_CACFS|nr:uncharacterized protein DFA_06944 [Cavenderia fasciculata]EGG19842.1 hypothetical protein DFA_06944 [Cavenderia fasciculata]|eukprot:XP_004358188.1 hypothetical protein DFA_06944 [Cavenderia fasciculata]